jgi:methylmalonyl-CoA/ethylmalonyl-CoA epimerase
MAGLVIELQELHNGRESRLAPASSPAPASLNEVHFACRDIDAAAAWMADALGLEVGPVVEQKHPPEEVRFRNLYLDGKPMIAVITPATQTSSIHRFLDRRGPGMFALSMGVADCQAFTDAMGRSGVPMLFSTPKVAQETYVGPTYLQAARINWVKPHAHTGNVLFEIQEFEQ